MFMAMIVMMMLMTMLLLLRHDGTGMRVFLDNLACLME